MNAYTVARKYGYENPGLGALDEVEETEEGTVFAFEEGSILITFEGEIQELWDTPY